MNIAIISYFRNSSSKIERYFDQMYGLRSLLARGRYRLDLVLGVGDSTDDTEKILIQHVTNMPDTVLIECSHGGPEFGSIVDPVRFKQLAFVTNKLHDRVPDHSDKIMWLESDLIWDPEVIYHLLLQSFYYSVISPLVFHIDPSCRFYDTFAFRRNGVNFTNDPPYHPDLNGETLEMDSVGSCIVMSKYAFWDVNIPEEDVFVGMCNQARSKGYGIYCNPNLRIFHP